MCFRNELVINQLSHEKIIVKSMDFSDRIEAISGNVNLVQKLIQINETPILFDDKFVSTDKEIKLISSEEINYIFQNGWESFYDEYGDSRGLVSFSKIAFSDDGSQAILECSQSFGPLFGERYVIILVKENDIWILKTPIATVFS